MCSKFVLGHAHSSFFICQFSRLRKLAEWLGEVMQYFDFFGKSFIVIVSNVARFFKEGGVRWVNGLIGSRIQTETRFLKRRWSAMMVVGQNTTFATQEDRNPITSISSSKKTHRDALSVPMGFQINLGGENVLLSRESRAVFASRKKRKNMFLE